jgi:hypothetical protein
MEVEKVKKESVRQIICCFYVFTVVFGSIYGNLHSFDNYWSRKANLVNQYFVKIGWFWTTIFFILNAKDIKAIIRWSLATSYWYIITQKFFFGPSIMDQIFVITGGKCVGFPQAYDAYTCKGGGGLWEGGYDLSGHCFLSIHSSLFLWEELICKEIARENNLLSIDEVLLIHWKFVKKNKIIGCLFILWWWMLFVTAIKFHSFLEKLIGTTFGVLYWAVMYNFVSRKFQRILIS